MKISVHLEADSAEELQSFFARFAGTPLAAAPSPVVEPVLVKVPPVEAALEAPAEEPAAQQPVEAPAAPKRARGRPRKEQPAEVPVAAPATIAQVESVQAAPAKIKEPDIEVLSRQDLLDAFAEYVQRYGANFGYTDISSLLQKHFGDGVRKASDVPEQSLQVAIGAIRTAITDNPFNRKRDYA